MILSTFLENISRGNNDIANLIRQLCIDLNLITEPFSVAVINAVNIDTGVGRVLAFADYTGHSTLAYREPCAESENKLLIHSKILETVLKSKHPVFIDNVNFNNNSNLPDVLLNCRRLHSLPLFSDGKVVI